ncbi:MAG: ribonuclease P [Thermoprotei archaeon ex4572_64]|nr:MAG: ribonuclease P [Thermoprotei archaeon ex4572_64]
MRRRGKYRLRSKCIDVLYKIVECVKCRNPTLNGLKGLVVSETKNTIQILTIDGTVKTIIKEECWYYVYDKSRIYLINGTNLRGYRDERLKYCTKLKRKKVLRRERKKL